MAQNEIGEIYSISAYKFLGYANNPEETKGAFDSAGWFKTGDLGYISEMGEIFIVDRKKDMIKYLNYQVAPSEIEGLIGKIAGITSVCVVGIPDMISGDLAAAIIVKDKNSLLTEQDVVDEVASEFFF
jgi:acyl-CoA synthetase (AMP-forming)/AMP-acid ligase II